MIEFHFETDFSIENQEYYTDWISRVIASEKGTASQINFIFCDDDYLLDLNKKYLGHDTYTDIITFDYSDGKRLSGDIFISMERVMENAKAYNTKFDEELMRVMAHGVLHMFGFNDKTDTERKLMRLKEDEKISMFHVEQ